jgi:hypothetical protein
MRRARGIVAKSHESARGPIQAEHDHRPGRLQQWNCRFPGLSVVKQTLADLGCDSIRVRFRHWSQFYIATYCNVAMQLDHVVRL